LGGGGVGSKDGFITIGRRGKMPYITVESGALSDNQKEELIKRLTEVSSDIMKVPQEFFVTTIKEVPDKNFGIGGKTIDKVKAEYMQTHK
jgi:4-oxalocrotonate tautomerase